MSKRLRVGFCLILFGFLANALAAQDGFFSPLNRQNLKTSLSADGLVSIVHGPGQVQFEMPLGPGLHSRGLSFIPLARLRPGQRLLPIPGGTNGPIWGHNVSKDIDDLSGFDLAATVGSYADGLAPHLVGGGTPDPLHNAYCLSWASYDLDGNPYPPVIRWDAPPAPSQTTLVWSEVGFSPDMGLSRGLNSGNGIVNIAPDSGQGEGTFILPDGTRISVLSVIGWTGDPVQNQTLVHDYLIDASQFGGLLSQYGFNLTDLDGKACLRGSDDSLVFFLFGSDGQDVTPPNNTYLTTKLPGRVLIVKANQAYIFQYLDALDVHEEPGQFGPDGEVVAPGGDFTDSVCYNLVSIRNRFGDRIDFIYGSNQFDYTANLIVDGVPTGDKIQLSLDSLAPSSVAVPDLNLTKEQADLGISSYLQHGIIKDAVIHVKYLTDAGIVASYKIVAKLDDPSIFLNLYNAGDSHQGPGLRYGRDYLQFTDIEDEIANYGVSFTWQWSTFHSNWAGGQDLGVATLASIQCGNGEKISFNYQGDNFVDPSFPSLWEGFYWGVSSVTRTDVPTGVSRTTQYSRNVPHATNWWPGTRLAWTNTDCWEAETQPDGTTIVRRYYPAVGSPDPGLRGSWIQQMANFVQDRLYKASPAFEEREYAPGVDWRSDM
ncbi:MAG TPA: hypothetical protein VFT46_02085, partial [Holophagaceae bacterium]|nr:hypothetical protein [Holophagaceae bacterium]